MARRADAGGDELRGEQTRPHEDLDIAIAHEEVPRLRALLGELGYRDVPRGATPANATHAGGRMKPWTALIVATVLAAAAASLGSALVGLEWISGLLPGALAGVVVFLVRFLSGATPSKGPWADAFLALERRVSRLEARGQPEAGGVGEQAPESSTAER